MKIKLNLIPVIVLFLMQLHTSGQNPIIQSIVDQVSGDSIFEHISVLQEIDRQTLKNYRECTDYICNCLTRSDFDTIYLQEMEFNWIIGGKDSVYTSLPNIIAIKYGKSSPDSFYILGAHYDAPWILDNPDNINTLADISTSPGADDNASGTAGVLEVARVLSGYWPERTLMVILFAAEEIGVAGSDYFIDNIDDKTSILGMINLDMISYSEGNDDPLAIIQANTNSMNMFNCSALSITQYVSALQYEQNDVAAGDYERFWEYNIPAISFIDGRLGFDDFNPYIHSLADTIGTSANDTILAELITKTVVATIMELDGKSVATSYDKITAKNPGFNLYPNPATHYIHVEIGDIPPADLTIEISNTEGEVIQSIIPRSKEMIIDISGYVKGIYFFRVGPSVSKLMKM